MKYSQFKFAITTLVCSFSLSTQAIEPVKSGEERKFEKLVTMEHKFLDLRVPTPITIKIGIEESIKVCGEGFEKQDVRNRGAKFEAKHSFCQAILNQSAARSLSVRGILDKCLEGALFRSKSMSGFEDNTNFCKGLRDIASKEFQTIGGNLTKSKSQGEYLSDGDSIRRKLEAMQIDMESFRRFMLIQYPLEDK